MTSLHNHTIFSDGDNTPEEMIEKAIELGFECFGISDHSYTFFDEEYCIKKDNIEAYINKINSLKEIYKDKITLLTGIEQDHYSGMPSFEYDYVIGSVHYIKVYDEKIKEDVYITVDESPDKAAGILKDAADKYFNGDIYSLTEAYFNTVGNIIEQTNADIIGHFDVISKCNQQYPIFDEEHPRYIEAWKKAALRLVAYNRPFEINISPVMRGLRTEPYPSKAMQDLIRKNGGKLIYTGDCHSVDELEQFAKSSKILSDYS